MKRTQHSKAFFVRAGSTKPKAPVRDNEHHDGGYQLILSNQVLLMRLYAHFQKKGRLIVI